ncbi:hypothetical protein [Amycolatopsis sp. NPDC051102]|uniref:hypothetical protein n=1 Tax=Amycolatopsis sp. NPDC051102 TaxID=3155163 RepID=UPI00341206B3
MTVWWGLAGLLGLLGCCGLLRGHRADGGAIEDDPLARYPAAREPATPNADAAHTPLMTPVITPEMLAARQGVAELQPEAALPESGRMVGEIPAPRPEEQQPVVEPRVPAAAAPVPVVQSGFAQPEPVPAVEPGVPAAAARMPAVSQGSAQPEQQPVVEPEVPAAAARVPVVPQEPAQPEPVPVVPPGSAQPAAVPGPQPQAAVPPQSRPRHARHPAEAAEPDTPGIPQARSEAGTPPQPGETAAPQATAPPGHESAVRGFTKRLLGRS